MLGFVSFSLCYCTTTHILRSLLSHHLEGMVTMPSNFGPCPILKSYTRLVSTIVGSETAFRKKWGWGYLRAFSSAGFIRKLFAVSNSHVTWECYLVTLGRKRWAVRGFRMFALCLFRTPPGGLSSAFLLHGFCHVSFLQGVKGTLGRRGITRKTYPGLR